MPGLLELKTSDHENYGL